MELRKISKNSIQSALEKARHYRLLNDPENAESICRDILEIDGQHQGALATMILALTDQFDGGSSRIDEARADVAKLDSEYERAYYSGLICERAAKVILASHRPESQHDAFHWFQNAMDFFDKAAKLTRDENNQDPVLRWNSCARLIDRHQLSARPAEAYRPYGD